MKYSLLYYGFICPLSWPSLQDKKDVEKIGATSLSDNNPNDHYLYSLIVHTGQLPNSGTKSKVRNNSLKEKHWRQCSLNFQY